MAQSQYSLPTSFNSSSLVRLLASLDITPVADKAPTFAESLSHWVAWTDAISLSTALGAGATAGTEHVQAGLPARVDAVVAQLRRLRKDLTESVANDSILSGANWGKSRSASTGEVNAGNEADFDFAAYRRSFSAQQRTMEERIGELRAAARAVASDHSPALRQLAALDAAMDSALGVHQRRVTANLPVLLEKRFKGGRPALQATPTRQADAPASVTGQKPPAGYGHTLQAVLLAEMEVRLLPVEGMIDALGIDSQDRYE